MSLLSNFNRSTALGISLTYLVAAGLWIFFSDQALLWAVGDPVIVARLQSLKGFAFVLVTAIFLYWLVQNRLPSAQIAIPPRTPRQRLALVILTILIGIAGLAFFSVLKNTVRHDVHSNLQAVAELKRQHIEYWLEERRTDAIFTATEWQSDQAFLYWLASGKDEKVLPVSARNYRTICASTAITPSRFTTLQPKFASPRAIRKKPAGRTATLP